MGLIPPLSGEYESWSFPGGTAVARRDVAEAVRQALAAHGTLYAWAAQQPGHGVFTGRGAAYGVALGPVRAVVRHARRGGLVAPLLHDRFLGEPRFVREIAWSHRLAADGVPTPVLLAGVRYGGLVHRADVATELVEGRDLASLLFGDAAPSGESRAAVMRAVGRLVRRLHVAGYVHPDLQLRNVLIVPASAGTGRTEGPAAWLLDVDTCREAPDARERRANLLRFYRSWEKWNRHHGPRLTETDRAAFEAGYAQSVA